MAASAALALLGACGSNHQVDGHFVYSDQDDNGNGVTVVITQSPAKANLQPPQRLEAQLASASAQARSALRQLQTSSHALRCAPEAAPARAVTDNAPMQPEYVYTLEIRHRQPAPPAYYRSANLACGQANSHWDGYIATEDLAALFRLLATSHAGS